MAFGFPAYSTTRFTLEVRVSDLHGTIRGVVGTLGWRVRKDPAEKIIARVGWNWRSWGEVVVIDLRPRNDITVTSRCILPTQRLDWGKNKANVKMFTEELRRQVQTMPRRSGDG